MFKQILIPTDGSELSERAVEKGIQLAKVHGANVTVVHVCPPFETSGYLMQMLQTSRAEFFQQTEEFAQNYLNVAARVAKKAGVRCVLLSVRDASPSRAIIATAKKKGCDLICMASHGRRRWQALVLGSETQKVLVHSKVPVLVLH